MTHYGLVSLVGAGPGDPDLITVRGLRRLEAAQVVAYDQLVDVRLLTACPAHAERLCVGKRAGRSDSWAQADIHEVLIDRARRGLRVVRLKGGDPFVFGRGGEEALALRRAGIPFEVVPGISAALAAPAHAGIPVTHRSLAASFAVVTGHEQPGGARVDWALLARAVDTLVVLMAVGRLADICAALVQHGRPADTPAALIHWASTGAQQTVRAPLHILAARAKAARLGAPATLVVGEVAALADSLDWFRPDTVTALEGAA